ncbi:hypothetical protein SAMN05444166_7336 [Singulisphaera sp. GP187]|nr:hypothetical protein SAMN05444166_7336 [Singulisphaera sp. GP187]
MVNCQPCEGVMVRAISCSAGPVIIHGEPFEPVPYGAETRLGWAEAPPERCRDCVVVIGGNHHPGCVVEECPACAHQLAACGFAPIPPALPGTWHLLSEAQSVRQEQTATSPITVSSHRRGWMTNDDKSCPSLPPGFDVPGMATDRPLAAGPLQ